MANFDEALKATLINEGGYSDRADDAGGKTNFGITERLARENGYFGDMKDFTIERAREIYIKNFWAVLRLEDISSQEVANKIFDISVNCGASIAGRMCQRALNALNRNGTDWPEIVVDGILGLRTVAVVNMAIKKRKENLLKCLNILQGIRYIELAENPTRRDEMNINGWFHRIKI